MKDVSEEVLNEARGRAKALVDEGKQERARILEEAKRAAGERKELMKGEADRTMAQHAASEMTRGRMKAKEIVQRARMDAIEDVYRQFYQSVDREKLLAALHALGEPQVRDVGAVCVSHRDVELAKKFFRVPVHEAPIRGGLLIESKDGHEVVNLSLEVLEELLQHSTMPAVYRLLFGKG